MQLLARLHDAPRIRQSFPGERVDLLFRQVDRDRLHDVGERRAAVHLGEDRRCGLARFLLRALGDDLIAIAAHLMETALPAMRRARRDDIRDATDFMGWYMHGTTQRLGISKADAANQYLAYHEGRTGFANGSYRAKTWLMAVAGRVQARAEMYQVQLISCGRA